MEFNVELNNEEIKLTLIIAVNSNLSNCMQARKIQDFNGVQTHDLAIPVRRSWVRTPFKSSIFQAHKQLLKLLFTDMIKANLISITAVHVYDSFHMQFPSIDNEELSHRWKSFEICKFGFISFLGVLENTLACSFVTHGF